MSKIVFFDIDGTLRDETYGIPGTAKIAVHMLKEKDYFVCVCTGRTRETIPDDVMELPMDGWISGGGSCIEFGGRVLWDSYFPQQVMGQVQHHFLGLSDHAGAVIETSSGIYMNEKACELLKKENEKKWSVLNEGEIIERKRGLKITYDDNLHLFQPEEHKVSKLCLWSTKEVFEEIKGCDFWKYTQLAQEDTTGFLMYHEMIQKGWNKGQAIDRLCRHLEIESKHVIAFGDGKNDIDMLRQAGVSIAMESGAPELCRMADAICEPPMQDGIYLELKRRCLI